jgi:hypothetical protein
MVFIAPYWLSLMVLMYPKSTHKASELLHPATIHFRERTTHPKLEQHLHEI